MRFGSVCSGIEAASVAWSSLGWVSSFLSEIDAFPRAVLKHRAPDAPLHGDFTTIRAGDYEPIDVLVGGTPCQSFSVAGLRGGMGDARGNLALAYLQLADRLRPRWLVWENVPGVLSSNGGRDFGSFLGGLGELGYGFAYRVLDAQYFRLAQRRKRVFVVGYLGDWRRAAAVLFEPASLRGDPPPRRYPGTGVAGTLTSSLGRRGGQPDGGDTPGQLFANYLTVREGKGPDSDATTTLIARTLRGEGFDASEDGTGRGTPIVPVAIPFDTTQITSAANYSRPQAGDPCHPLAAGAHAPAIAFNCMQEPFASEDVSPTMPTGSTHGQGALAVALRGRDGGAQIEIGDDLAFTLRASQGGGDKPHVMTQAVRRLTPRECERLQGFPDDWTLIPWRGGHAPDGPRYKALGNSMAVPVMRWIGERIQAVERAA